jgi:hypothetical protein
MAQHVGVLNGMDMVVMKCEVQCNSHLIFLNLRFSLNVQF